MSLPISKCLQFKAARGDEASYAELVRQYSINMTYGHWTEVGCNHVPPCETPTQSEVDLLNKRLSNEVWPKSEIP